MRLTESKAAVLVEITASRLSATCVKVSKIFIPTWLTATVEGQLIGAGCILGLGDLQSWAAAVRTNLHSPTTGAIGMITQEIEGGKRKQTMSSEAATVKNAWFDEMPRWLSATLAVDGCAGQDVQGFSPKSRN